MTILCPKSPDHHTFAVTAHVAEAWMVDRKGNFLKVLEPATDVVHSPDCEDMYTCRTCGTQAISKPD